MILTVDADLPHRIQSLYLVEVIHSLYMVLPVQGQCLLLAVDTDEQILEALVGLKIKVQAVH